VADDAALRLLARLVEPQRDRELPAAGVDRIGLDDLAVRAALQLMIAIVTSWMSQEFERFVERVR